MDEIKIFQIINRINSVLFLVLLMSGLVLILFISAEINSMKNRGAVEVAEKPEDKSSPKIELVLGGINDISGHDVVYVELRSKDHGGKFSSGYSRGETRNVLFLVGKELNTKWLFSDHTNFIKRVVPLKIGGDYDKEDDVLSIYYEIVNEDTNRDGILNSDDLSIIALTKPDGNNYTVIDSGVQSVIDRTLIDEGKSFALLTQSEGMVHLKKYSVETFELISSKTILNITGRP